MLRYLLPATAAQALKLLPMLNRFSRRRNARSLPLSTFARPLAFCLDHLDYSQTLLTLLVHEIQLQVCVVRAICAVLVAFPKCSSIVWPDALSQDSLFWLRTSTVAREVAFSPVFHWHAPALSVYPKQGVPRLTRRIRVADSLQARCRDSSGTHKSSRPEIEKDLVLYPVSMKTNS